MKFEEQIIKSVNHAGKEVSLGIFWVDEDYNVDAENLPPKEEMAALLKSLLMGRKIEIEAGRTVEE